MRKIIQYLITAVALVVTVTGRGGAEERYVPLPTALDGSMMPYDFRICTQPPTLPDSLRGEYVAYVARHGARYLSGPGKVEAVMKSLLHGRNTGTLSETGEAFLRLMEQVRDANDGNWGELSPVGIEEEKLLGERLCRTLPALRDAGTEVNCVSSHVPRVVMTMYQCTHRLIRNNDLIEVRTDEGPQYDSLLCCFVADTAYASYRANGAWRGVYDKFVERTVSADPARRLFTQTKLSEKKLRKLTMDMYEVLKGNRAAGLPAPTTQWMSEREYHECWEADNLRHYLRNTVNRLDRHAAQATAPLLKRIIADADKAMEAADRGERHTALNGYFGHCETLLPLLSVMNLPRCEVGNTDALHLPDCWRIQDISPLGANLMILFARSDSGRWYAVVQLNGRTARPMHGQPDIVAWDTLRSYWQSNMAADGVKTHE